MLQPKKILLRDRLHLRFVSSFLKLNPEAMSEVEKIEGSNFNIFKIENLTMSNELVVTVSHILARERFFSMEGVSFEIVMNFLEKI